MRVWKTKIKPFHCPYLNHFYLCIQGLLRKKGPAGWKYQIFPQNMSDLKLQKLGKPFQVQWDSRVSWERFPAGNVSGSSSGTSPDDKWQLISEPVVSGSSWGWEIFPSQGVWSQRLKNWDNPKDFGIYFVFLVKSCEFPLPAWKWGRSRVTLPLWTLKWRIPHFLRKNRDLTLPCSLRNRHKYHPHKKDYSARPYFQTAQFELQKKKKKMLKRDWIILQKDNLICARVAPKIPLGVNPPICPAGVAGAIKAPGH